MRAYLCKYPGCTHMVDTPRTYCKQHEALGQAADARKADAPKPQWPGAERPNEGLYHTARWRKLRQEVMREIGQCVICGATEHLQVHHIMPPKGDETLFFDRDNLTVLCESCHARMTSAEAREVKNAKR